MAATQLELTRNYNKFCALLDERSNKLLKTSHLKDIKAIADESAGLVLAVVYGTLTKVPQGRSVASYCKELGHSDDWVIKQLIRQVGEEAVRADHLDPYTLPVGPLYELLGYVCGLSGYGDSKWGTPGDNLEWHIRCVLAISVELSTDSTTVDSIDQVIGSISALQMHLSKILWHTETLSGVLTSRAANKVIVHYDSMLRSLTAAASPPPPLPAATSIGLPAAPDTATTLSTPTSIAATTNTTTTATSLPTGPATAITSATVTAAPTFNPAATVATTTHVAPPATSPAPPTASPTPAPTTSVLTPTATPISASIAATSTTTTPIPTAPMSASTTPGTSLPILRSSKQIKGGDIDEGDMNVLKLHMAVRPGSPTAKNLALLYTKLTMVATGQTVEDYYKTVLVHRNFNKDFNSHEKNILKDPYWDHNKSDVVDVTFVFKMLLKVCDCEWDKPGPLEDNLKVIKNVRNYFSHEAVTLDDKELQNKINQLKASFTLIFPIVESKKRCSLSKELKTLTDNLDGIPDYKIGIQISLEDCQVILAQARKERANLISQWAKVELIMYYDHHLKSASPITWLLSSGMSKQMLDLMNIDDVFTDLKILKTNVPVLLENILSLGRAVIIQGKPGVGKTTAIQHLTRKWSLVPVSGVVGTEITELKNTGILLVMRCRKILSVDLIRYLKDDILKDSLKNVDDKEVFPILNEISITVFVDGWDEAKPKAKTVVHEALQKLPGALFLFTSRPEFVEDLRLSFKDYSKIVESDIADAQIVGFSVESRSIYVKKMFKLLKKDHQSDEDQFMHFLEEKEDIIGDMAYVPLTLAFLVVLWNDDRQLVSSVTSMTELFVQLITMMIKRLVERLRNKSDPEKDDDNLPIKCRNWLEKELGKEAWDALKQDLHSLPESSKNRLQDICANKDLSHLEMFQAFLVSEPDVNDDSDNINWNFMHKTIQEFFIARYLHTLVIEKREIIALFFKDQSNLTRTNLYVPDSENILYFLCGLLNRSNMITPQSAEQILRVSKVLSDKYHIVGRLILESQKNQKTHPTLLEYVKNEAFVIDEIQSADIYLVKALMEATSSTLNRCVQINVKKITKTMKEVIEELYFSQRGFRPKMRLKCTADLIDLANHLNDLSGRGLTECHTRLTVSTSHQEEYFAGGSSCNYHDIISAIPDLNSYIQSNKVASDLPNDITELGGYIGEVSDEIFPQVKWLLKNTNCRLHPGTGRSISKVLELVDGLKDLIDAGEPLVPLSDHMRNIWFSIDNIEPEHIPAVSWLMKHTRSHLFTWSREYPMTGANVNVQHGTSCLYQMVQPHFKSKYRSIPLVFDFSSLDSLLEEGKELVSHISDSIKQHDKEELVISLEVEFLRNSI